MAVHRDEILSYLHETLEVAAYRDYGPQGLQVEGRETVRKIVTGVSACAALFERAAAAGADLVLVHHGILWDRDPRVVSGARRRRLQLLLEHELTLAAYHLCLDAHPILGNNALAARHLGLRSLQPWCERHGRTLGWWGEWGPTSVDEAVRRIEALYATKALLLPGGPPQVRTVGIISGGAQGEIHAALELGLDLFVTGEASEFVMHTAAEGGIHFVAAGHHATERLGIRALGRDLAARFALEHEFVDLPNPV
jgi:dinuclear metal center YbgI/SA1388 family protein